jgi:hypothetical protein
MIEIAQMIHAGLPTVAEMPPIENNTSAGTPLATQNAPCQPILRCSEPCPDNSAAEFAACELFDTFILPFESPKSPHAKPVEPKIARENFLTPSSPQHCASSSFRGVQTTILSRDYFQIGNWIFVSARKNRNVYSSGKSKTDDGVKRTNLKPARANKIAAKGNKNGRPKSPEIVWDGGSTIA